MKKRILLPTDYSKNALNAIRYALDLYQDFECDFYFLNKYTVTGYSLDSMMVPEPGEKLYEAAKKASEDGMERLMEILKLHPENSKHTYHTISTYNSLLLAVENIIAKKDIDVIVMGTKGNTGASSVIFGTNTVAIMEKITNCPVIAVPANYSFSPPKEIVFPTDYKADYKRKELIYLLEIAKAHKCAIRVLHVSEEAELNTKQKNNKILLEDILEGLDFSFHTLSNIKVSKGINTFVESRGSDMVAFLNKKHFFFGSLLSNPLVKEIGYNTNIPVLVLKDND
ncbi:nucleotide-binding universal stress UspA family protein [Saonia flava]|uniref:Nucleotide-binding universal stress UspA family protein n=1 Tax=Saonia flava TaxID=523696 RepID=A0A846R158_9FLAO|nr:universal stress protein [Saonia flava]NJB72163.1 nucleotide-binding universal stress UspA family protein [Saonia flava]